MKYFTKLNSKDIIYLLAIAALLYVWILTDQIFIKESHQRFVAIILLVPVLFYALLRIRKPKSVFPYTNSLVLIILTLTIVISLITHTIVHHDFSCKVIYIWLVMGFLPYIASIIYKFQYTRPTSK